MGYYLVMQWPTAGRIRAKNWGINKVDDDGEEEASNRTLIASHYRELVRKDPTTDQTTTI